MGTTMRTSTKLSRRQWLKRAGVFVPVAFAISKAKAIEIMVVQPAAVASATLKDSWEWTTTTYVAYMSNNYYNSATDFYPTASFTLNELRIYCEQTGTPTMSATPYIYSDSSGNPGSALTGGTGTAFALNTCPPASSPASFAITGFSCSLTNGSRYWLVLNFGSSYSNTNTVKIYCALLADAAYHVKQADSPPTWANGPYQTAMGWQAYGV